MNKFTYADELVSNIIRIAPSRREEFTDLESYKTLYDKCLDTIKDVTYESVRELSLDEVRHEICVRAIVHTFLGWDFSAEIKGDIETLMSITKHPFFQWMAGYIPTYNHVTHPVLKLV